MSWGQTFIDAGWIGWGLGLSCCFVVLAAASIDRAMVKRDAGKLSWGDVAMCAISVSVWTGAIAASLTVSFSLLRAMIQ